jgi:formate hydrogenlyase subunit 3/multisubunit Na+/H+ antiporter MnhD subunit
VPLGLIGLWLLLSLVLVACSTFPGSLHRLRWLLLAAVVVVLAVSITLVWRGQPELPPRFHGGLTFDEVAHLLLPPLWIGSAIAIATALFMPSGRYEPAIGALTAAAATAGVLSANALLTIALLQAGALIVLAGLLVHDEGLSGHPLLNVATSLKFLTLTVISGACLVMALLLANFYAINQDRLELTRIIAAVIVVGFGLAAGAMPFYFHLPDLFDAAPTLATVSLVGPMQCLAFVYLIRTIGNGPWLLTDEHVSNALIGGALAGALLASVLAFGQRRLNRVLAFNAMREVSWIAFGLASASRTGWIGALVLLAVRCVSQPVLLAAARVVQQRTGEAEVDKLGELAKVLPFVTFAWLAAAFASLGLPPAGTFWGLAALLRVSLAAGGLVTAALLASGLLGLWRLGQLTYAVFWRRARGFVDTAPQPLVSSWILAAAGASLVVAGVVPRLLQTSIDQLLAGFPFLH